MTNITPFIPGFVPPLDLRKMIFGYLDADSCKNASLTCKAWAKVITNGANTPYWHKMLLKRFGALSDHPYDTFQENKRFFREKIKTLFNTKSSSTEFLDFQSPYLLTVGEGAVSPIHFMAPSFKVFKISSKIHLLREGLTTFTRPCLWNNQLVAPYYQNISFRKLDGNSEMTQISMKDHHNKKKNMIVSWEDKIICGDFDGIITIWEASGKYIRTLQGRAGWCSFSKVDQNELIRVIDKQWIELFDLETGEKKWQATIPRLSQVQVSKNIISLFVNNQSILLDRKTGDRLFESFDFKLIKLFGEHLITFSIKKEIQIWKLGVKIPILVGTLKGSANAFCGAGEKVFIAAGHTIRFIDLEFPKDPEILVNNLPNPVQSLLFKGGKLFAILNDGSLFAWFPTKSKRQKV